MMANPFLLRDSCTVVDIMKDELPRSVGAQYSTGEEWKDNTRKNEETEPRQKQHPVVDALMIEARSDAVKNNIA